MRLPKRHTSWRPYSVPTVWPAYDEPVGTRAVSDVSEWMERLEHENEQLRYALESRPVIDLAGGADGRLRLSDRGRVGDFGGGFPEQQRLAAGGGRCGDCGGDGAGIDAA